VWRGREGERVRGKEGRMGGRSRIEREGRREERMGERERERETTYLARVDNIECARRKAQSVSGLVDVAATGTHTCQHDGHGVATERVFEQERELALSMRDMHVLAALALDSQCCYNLR
jgi:hypothetical protein